MTDTDRTHAIDLAYQVIRDLGDIVNMVGMEHDLLLLSRMVLCLVAEHEDVTT